jgi:nicotinate-nucleotide adenylyltransferase
MGGRRRIGIFGGTFDPVHFGHLRVAEEVAEIHGLSRVLFVPNRRPPHKASASVASAEGRLHMVKVAVEGNRRFAVSDFELRREGPSYTLDTLRYFGKYFGNGTDLFFLIGADAFAEIGTWHEAAAVLTLADFVVMTRPGTRLPRLDRVLPRAIARSFKPAADCVDCDDVPWRLASGRTLWPTAVTHLDISASDIRRRVAEEKSIRFLTPEAVRAYIARRKLYRVP